VQIINSKALPKLINSLLLQPFARTDVENGYYNKQKHRGDENEVQHVSFSPSAEAIDQGEFVG